MKKRILCIVLLSFFLLSCGPQESASYTEVDVSSNSLIDYTEGEQESKAEKEGVKVATEVKNDVSIYRFLLPEEEKLPIIRIGLSIFGFYDTERWLAFQTAVNEYLREQGKYQIETVVVEPNEEEGDEKAVQQCLAENVDILLCQGMQSEALDLNQFIDLGENPYRTALEPFFALYPEKYWEYIEQQLGGIYSLSHEISPYGSLCITLTSNERTQQAGVNWEPMEGRGFTWEKWENQFRSWQEEYGERVAVLRLASTLVEGNDFLPYLAPETECQIVAPGIGIELVSGQVVKILEQPVMQERAALYQSFMDQGIVAQEPVDTVIVDNISGESAWGAVLKHSSGSQYWKYFINHSQLYYPVTMDYGVYFAGIPLEKESRMELILQMYQDIAEDAALRELFIGNGAFLSVLFHPIGLLELDVNQAAEFYQEDGQQVDGITLELQEYQHMQFSPVSGFRFDSSTVQEEIEALWCIVNTSPTKRSFEVPGNNATFLEDIKALQNDMEEAGLSIVYEEVCRQLEQWKAASEAPE